MAASAKRKQEEKHLKMLREMTSLPPNRKCFDCDQRGPTYANMTVGSFVCTSCSGILRGINPPHRVKSISMTTFTQQEIEFLQKNGNEVCKHMWLGLYDERATPVPDFRDPQKAKAVASVHASVSGSSNSSTSSTPEVRPLKTLLGGSPVVSRAAAHHHHQQQQQQQQQQHFHDKKFDLLSDLGGDIFAAPPNPHAGSSANFANFAHFNSHPPPTNPFVAAPPAAATNPFQSNGRAAAVAAAASFGTGSMSMPSGFGNSSAYNLPTSFSGGFAAFGPAGAPAAQYPAGGSSTNPFL
ncbi:hypothetical protein CRUP_022674 [Coryphaenoides rupestris]|nr:hypothetical protein CRUP_022674 [Coryphaenoides rupestris]